MSDTEDNTPEETNAEEKRQREAMGALHAAETGASALDASAAKSSLSALQITKNSEGDTVRRKALQEVQISLDDVQLLMRELELSRAAAEHALREHKGSVEDALRSLINNA